MAAKKQPVSTRRNPIEIKKRVIAGWVLLGVVAAFVGTASVLSVANYTGKASKASVEAVAAKVNPTQADVVKAACAYATNEGLKQGVQVTKCGLAKGKGAYQTKGDVAQVIVQCEASQPVEGAPNGIRFALAVTLSKGIWQGTGVQLAAEPEAIK